MMKMKKPLIKVFGERNTGTNYLHNLIKLNIDVDFLPNTAPRYITEFRKWLPGQHERLVDIYFHLTSSKNLGWKHSLVIPSDIQSKIKKGFLDRIYFITLTKNPYSWLLSLYNRPHHFRYKFNFFRNPILLLLSLYKNPSNYTIKMRTFEHFLLSPWLTVGRENTKTVIENPIILWNIKNASYVKLKLHLNCINLKYENLLLNPEKVIQKICNDFRLIQKAKNFKNIEKSTKGDKKDFTYYHKYYLEEKWKEKLSKKSIKIIDKYLDQKLLLYYLYEKLT